MSNITTYRGDTRPIVRNVTVGGVATNITGWSFILTINEEESPADTTNQIAQSIGIVTDGAAGEVSFPQSFEMSENVGRFFYDIETTDANGKRATSKGLFTVLQDITKPVIVHFDLEGTEGELVADGDDLWVSTTDVYGSATDIDKASYEVRDTVPVIRLPSSFALFSAQIGNAIIGCGPEAPRLGLVDQYLEVRAYINDESNGIGLFYVGLVSGWWPNDNTPVGYSVYVFKQPISETMALLRMESGRIDGDDWGELLDPFAMTIPGYYTVRLEVLYSTGVVRAKAWADADGDPGTWLISKTETGSSLPLALYPAVRCNNNMNGYVDVASMEWGTL